jgi:hypothetical protein
MIMLFPPEAIAAELTPNYQQSVILSRQHADSPSDGCGSACWRQTGSYHYRNPATEILPSVSTMTAPTEMARTIHVRTLTKASYYQSNYVNQSGYRIFGNPTTDAAWVTTGNEMTTSSARMVAGIHCEAS